MGHAVGHFAGVWVEVVPAGVFFVVVDIAFAICHAAVFEIKEVPGAIFAIHACDEVAVMGKSHGDSCSIGGQLHVYIMGDRSIRVCIIPLSGCRVGELL